MGERTDNLNLYVPTVVPAETGWGEEVGGNFQTIDEVLNAAAKSVFIGGDGIVCIAVNADYDRLTDVWNRRSTGSGAVMAELNQYGKYITLYNAPSGANPIVWTEYARFAQNLFNIPALETDTVNGIIPLPPDVSRLVEVAPTLITPTILASYPGPYADNGGANYEVDQLNYVVPADLSVHGLSALFQLVKLTVTYTMTTSTWYSFTKVYVNNVECTPLTRTHPGESAGGTYTATATATIYVARGSTLRFITMNDSNAGSDPVITDIVITLEGGFPFGEVVAANYPTIAGVPGAVLTPYHFAHDDIECTCDFDGPTATMNDYGARPYFPHQPVEITLAWKSGKTWATTYPVLKFYRGRA